MIPLKSFRAKQLAIAGSALPLLWLVFARTLSAAPQAAPSQATGQAKPTAGQFFKNVKTTALRGLTVDDFLGVMGVMSAAVGFDCSDCHPGAGFDKVDWEYLTFGIAALHIGRIRL